MSTKLSKPVTRVVNDERGKPLIVTLTADGVTFRRPRKRESYLLPYAAAETRAQVLACDGVGLATGKRSRRVSRGLLSVN